MDLQSLLQKFNIKSEQEDFDVIHDAVEKGIFFKGTNLWILIFAIIIACVGLNMNSTAVIIGAMLISPLMGPILGIGYGLATYEFVLMRKALINLGFAVFSGLFASTLYFWLTPISEAHSELLARTQPNIYDVIIALVGGLAGIIALSSKQKGNVIPGVAIATALMPPLCTAGYGLATGKWTYFFGAFYLFAINTVFIATAIMITVRLLKYPKWHMPGEDIKKSANRWVSFIVTITMIPSIYFGYLMVKQEKFNVNANSFIRNETFIEGDYLLKTEVDPAKRTIKLIYGGRLISDESKEEVVAKARHYDLEGAEIIIQQGFSVDEDQENVLAITSQQSEINRLRAELSHALYLQDSITQSGLLGKQLFVELKALFPEIVSCSTSEQTLFGDSTSSTSFKSLYVLSSNPSGTIKEKNKIEDWYKSRVNSDNVKVYIE